MAKVEHLHRDTGLRPVREPLVLQETADFSARRIQHGPEARVTMKVLDFRCPRAVLKKRRAVRPPSPERNRTYAPSPPFKCRRSSGVSKSSAASSISILAT